MAVTDSNASGTRPRAPVHLWIVGVLALLWNAMGVFDYLATELKLGFYMSQFTEEQLAYFFGFPAWAVAGWAFGVWGGLAGAVGLLLRRRWAVWAFAVSLAGLLVSSIYTHFVSNGAAIMGSEGTVFTLIIWAVAIFLLLYARAQAKRGVLV